MNLRPTSNFHSIILNQISDQIHKVSFCHSFHTVGRVSASVSKRYGRLYAQNHTRTSKIGIAENAGLPQIPQDARWAVEEGGRAQKGLS